MLTMLWRLPSIVVAEHGEVINFIDSGKLFSTGVGYVDVHLLASVMLMPHACLWTRDGRLDAAARRLGIAVPKED